jgi:NADH-quinone oxidoreductase subunit K
MVPLHYYLFVSAVLFILGTLGVLTRRNALVVLMSIELMMNGVNLSFIAYSRYVGNMTGHIYTLLSISVAAAEVAIGLAILIALYRNKPTINIDDFSIMKF